MAPNGFADIPAGRVRPATSPYPAALALAEAACVPASAAPVSTVPRVSSNRVLIAVIKARLPSGVLVLKPSACTSATAWAMIDSIFTRPPEAEAVAASNSARLVSSSELSAAVELWCCDAESCWPSAA